MEQHENIDPSHVESVCRLMGTYEGRTWMMERSNGHWLVRTYDGEFVYSTISLPEAIDIFIKQDSI